MSERTIFWTIEESGRLVSSGAHTGTVEECDRVVAALRACTENRFRLHRYPYRWDVYAVDFPNVTPMPLAYEERSL